MATASRLKLGPRDHGRRYSYGDFAAADWDEGFRYELIDGKLYVSPQPDLPHGVLDRWIFKAIDRYADEHPEVLNYTHYKARVFVPGRRGTTCPEPDIVAYNDFPTGENLSRLRWQDISPLLVVEVLSPDNLDKDLVRNVELYLLVPSIREYWIVDGLQNTEQPSLRVHRRRGSRWRSLEIAFGETYTTKLLPGFELVIDPRR